jgi:hypothetical protein
MDSAAHGPHQPASASGKPDAAAAARERKAVLLARLERLGTLAMEVVERTQVLAVRATDRDIAALDAAPADSPALPAESSGPVLSFARASRIARDCITMELRIAAGDAPAGDDASDRRMSPAARRRLTAMKNEVRLQVEGAIRAHAEPLLVDRLLLDLDERLDDPDVEAEFGVLTLGQMVLSVCHDLRVKPEVRLMSEDMLQTAISAHYGTPMPKPAAAHGMTKGMAADPTVEKLPTGVIGSPGVPPAIDLPPWSNQPRPQQSPAPPGEPLRNGHAGPDPPAAPRRPPGSVFSR